MRILSLLSWVMLENVRDFVRLPREKVLISSPSRTSLALQTPNSYPGKEPLSIKCSDGRAIITNQRVSTGMHRIAFLMALTSTRQLIYLPAQGTPQLQSLSAPLLSLQDTHVSAPFFGPNVWEGILIPTAGGGFSPHHHVVQIKLTFKEGGAFDFHSTFERIKEQVAHAAEISRESGRSNGNTSGPIDIDLEQLPAYEEVGSSGRMTQPASAPTQQEIQRPVPISPDGTAHQTPGTGASEERAPKPAPGTTEVFPPPSEPPPGYEEVQSRSIASDLEGRLREQNGHGAT